MDVVCDPWPGGELEGLSFCVTGDTEFGADVVKDWIEARGGMLKSYVTQKLDVLVLCELPKPTWTFLAWAFSTFGRKLQKTMAWREAGKSKTLVVSAKELMGPAWWEYA